MMRTAAQLRAARGLLDWSQGELADAAGVALSTIRRMEIANGMERATAGNVWKVQRVLEVAGILFIDSNGGGPGVRLRVPIEP
jgi:transcriptional regulator with XRE-family HTH domain